MEHTLRSHRRSQSRIRLRADRSGLVQVAATEKTRKVAVVDKGVAPTVVTNDDNITDNRV